jgi:STAS domain
MVMTGIAWEGPQHARPAPWAGRRARGYGRTRGLRLDVRPGDQPVVAVGGEIDRHSGAELRDELLRVLHRHGPRLILDLHDVTFMDSAGIGTAGDPPPGAARGRLGTRGPGLAVCRADAHARQPATGIRRAEGIGG